jgi:hypothetical protein
MKSLFLAALLLFSLCSCVTMAPMERRVITDVYDFRPYSEKGFYITPNPYFGEFDPIGQIYISIFPGRKEITTKNEKGGFGEETETTSMRTETISSEEMMELIYKKAIDLKANGISNFKMQYVYSTLYDAASHTQLKILDHYELEGFAIKRK